MPRIMGRERVEYSFREDVQILKYIHENELWHLTAGNKMWQIMEKNKFLPGRTFHSLRNRFLRTILHRLFTDYKSVINLEEVPKDFIRQIAPKWPTFPKKERTETLPFPRICPANRINVGHDDVQQNDCGGSSSSLVSSPGPSVSAVNENVPHGQNNVDEDGFITTHCATPNASVPPVARRRLYSDDQNSFINGPTTSANNCQQPQAIAYSVARSSASSKSKESNLSVASFSVHLSRVGSVQVSPNRTDQNKETNLPVAPCSVNLSRVVSGQVSSNRTEQNKETNLPVAPCSVNLSRVVRGQVSSNGTEQNKETNLPVAPCSVNLSRVVSEQVSPKDVVCTNDEETVRSSSEERLTPRKTSKTDLMKRMADSHESLNKRLTRSHSRASSRSSLRRSSRIIRHERRSQTSEEEGSPVRSPGRKVKRSRIREQSHSDADEESSFEKIVQEGSPIRSSGSRILRSQSGAKFDSGSPKSSQVVHRIGRRRTRNRLISDSSDSEPEEAGREVQKENEPKNDSPKRKEDRPLIKRFQKQKVGPVPVAPAALVENGEVFANCSTSLPINNPSPSKNVTEPVVLVGVPGRSESSDCSRESFVTTTSHIEGETQEVIDVAAEVVDFQHGRAEELSQSIFTEDYAESSTPDDVTVFEGENEAEPDRTDERIRCLERHCVSLRKQLIKQRMKYENRSRMLCGQIKLKRRRFQRLMRYIISTLKSSSNCAEVSEEIVESHLLAIRSGKIRRSSLLEKMMNGLSFEKRRELENGIKRLG